MNQKKSTKILMILIIAVLAIILVGGIAFAYLTTDIFRSEKDLFFKYMTQIGDSEKGFLDNQLKGYWEKKKNTPYNNEGNFSVNIIVEEGQEQFKNVNDFSITYSGQVDAENLEVEQNISLNYSDKVNFPISYKQLGNTIGLQTKYVGSKYIAVDTDNLENLTDGSEISLDLDINSLKNISQFELTEEEKTHIKDTYFGVLNTYLGEEKFSKVEEANVNGYKLSLTGEELKNILTQLLETLKNDQITIDLINESLQVQEDFNEISKDNIDDLIEEINNDTDLEEQNLEIIVYSKKGITNKVTISTDELKIDIQKENTSGDIKYYTTMELTQDEDMTKIYLNSTYSGISSMQNINEIYELGVELEELKYKYTLKNNINFTGSVNIQEFASDNSMILTNYESEQVSNFLNAVRKRLVQVNKKQMEELGLEEDENPIQYLIPSLDMFSINGDIINKSTLSEEQINTFNSRFENYEGTNQQAQTVKGLLSTISLNNQTQENDDMKITEINFNGEEYESTKENITSIKDNMNMEKNYRIEFEKESDTGLIFRAVINER